MDEKQPEGRYQGQGRGRVRELLTDPSVDPEDDSDSALWKHWKYHNHQRKVDNLTKNTDALHSASDTAPKGDWIQHTEYHFSYLLNRSRLDYWPSTNKWRWNGRNYSGTIRDLFNFIKKREL
jgi:hypothetical protein